MAVSLALYVLQEEQALKVQAFCPDPDYNKQTVISTVDDEHIHVDHASGFQFICTIEQLRQLITELTLAVNQGERILAMRNGLKLKSISNDY